MAPPLLSIREHVREQRFSTVWTQELNSVFADVAPYYDRANTVASLGLWNWFLSSFMSTIDLRPGQRALDVCAGTNAIGIALLRREPTLEVHAIDRSAEMQEVGRQRAGALGFHIHSVIGDVHALPFPDSHFDVVTLQYATRHLRVKDVFREIHRVLKPGGRMLFVEHTRSVQPPLAVLQDALTPLWKQVGGGCHLNRSVIELVRGAGFTLSETASVWREHWTLLPVYRGVAVRPAS
jgi:demethylmenaquinone methyltransferase/2-methoxy-6-polyprenyl-1,4-benzoquinol methylase